MLPHGDPLCVKLHKIKKKVKIARGLDGYIQHWIDVSNKDGTAAYKAHMSHLVTCWTGVRNAYINSKDSTIHVQTISSIIYFSQENCFLSFLLVSTRSTRALHLGVVLILEFKILDCTLR